MKQYSEYKDSGVKWIGEIPGHWKKNKIMRLFTHIGSGTTPKGDQYYTDESNGIPWINSGDLNYGFLTKCNKYITEKALNDISTLKKYPINTLMIAMYGASIGKYAISHIEGCTNQACCALYGIKDELNLTYASYLMGPCKQKWIEESFGGTQPNISAEKIKQTWLPLPPLPEQEAIVTYLDSKVAKIDEYISIAEKKIAALEELKQTIIAEAVTRGIHKDVPMKDSGVKWIGEIPGHWDLKRTAMLFSENRKKNINYEFDHALKFNYGKLVSKNEIGDVSSLKETYMAYTIINKNDIAINCLNLNYDFVSQRVAISPQKGIITSAYLIITPRQGVEAMYYNYLFKAMDSKKLFHGMGTGIRLTLSFSELKKQQIPVPLLSEQQEIVTYIEEKVANINQLCQAERSQIEKLKEYKQRLISDVVTGKVKVTND